jgi:hypothetical protein
MDEASWLRDVQIVPEPRTAAIGRLAAYWEGLLGSAFAPPRRAVDPAALVPDLPHLFMLDVLRDGADYRYRLVGTEVVAFSGRDVTGKSFSELYGDRPEVFERVIALFGTVLSTRRPVYARGKVFWLAERKYREFEGGYFPLSRDGARIDIILCEVTFRPPGP